MSALAKIRDTLSRARRADVLVALWMLVGAVSGVIAMSVAP